MNTQQKIAAIEQHIQDLDSLNLDIAENCMGMIFRNAKHPCPERYQDVDASSVLGRVGPSVVTEIPKMLRDLGEELFRLRVFQQHEETGKCVLRVSARDCDLTRYSFTSKFDTVEEALAWRERTYAGAEGPMVISIVTGPDFTSANGVEFYDEMSIG
jgi:hypothetical protein